MPNVITRKETAFSREVFVKVVWEALEPDHFLLDIVFLIFSNLSFHGPSTWFLYSSYLLSF
jgi:hypothetical protein